ncbi:MAG: phosphate acyltransferase PlsX [Bacillota bacterium]|nr:phosphate acyltransferase PlsX [Bacillota bacterium]
MRIVLDAFGGDKAPLEIVKGAVAAVKNLSVDITLTGNKSCLEKIFAENSLSLEKIELVHAEDVITMEDDPVKAVRRKTDSSLVIAMKLLAEGKADAFVGATNTGAVLTAATLIVGRVKGVKRPALSPIIPSAKGPFMLIDCGANVECKSEYLIQFAQMGALYMKKILNIQNPRVGLLNNGTEEHKGTALQIETYSKLKESPVNFVGNVEANSLMYGACDVIVTDGYTGNILLKSIEGTSKMIMNALKDMFYSSFSSKLAALILKNKIKSMAKGFDAKEYGGVPLLGISKPVIKAHGSSDAKAIENAIKQAVNFCNSGMIETMEKEFNKTEE